MKLSLSSPATRLGLCLTAILLTGCSTAEPVASIKVISPPPPLVGSAPIAAYDEYARAIAPPVKIRIEAVAQAGGLR